MTSRRTIASFPNPHRTRDGCRYLQGYSQRVQPAVAARILGSEFVGSGTRNKVILVSSAIPRTCLCTPLCRWLLLSAPYGLNTRSRHWRRYSADT